MNFRIKKFRDGIRTNPSDTLIKVVKYGAMYTGRGVWKVIETILIIVYRILLFPLPASTLAKLKDSLKPTVRLDYRREKILLSADSPWSIKRSRACEKEPNTVFWIENFMQPGEVLFDVGANVGAYSLIACKYFKHNLIVHAFEPSFSTYYELSRNIFLNGCQDNIFPHLIGLTEKSDFVPLHFSSLEAGSAGHWFGESFPANFSSKTTLHQKVLGYTIDQLIEAFNLPVPNHLKVDVDGTEMEVLHGADKTLQLQDVKSILIEVRDTDGMDNEVKEFLLSKGFHLISETDHDDEAVWNCIYVRETGK